MSLIILDIGSGASIPDEQAARRIVESVGANVPAKHLSSVVLKAQLFESAPPNQPLDREVFAKLHRMGSDRNIRVTSSVFDLPSLSFLLGFEPHFVKIACRPALYPLIGEVPRKIPVFASYDCRTVEKRGVLSSYKVDVGMSCVPEYPAKRSDYPESPTLAYSDHTVGLELYRELKPQIWEKHYVLEKGDPANPDSQGGFAITPEDLRVLFPNRQR